MKGCIVLHCIFLLFLAYHPYASEDLCPSLDSKYPSVPCIADNFSPLNIKNIKPFQNKHSQDTGVLLCPGRSMDKYTHNRVDRFNNSVIVASVNSGIYAPFAVDYMFIRHFFPDKHDAALTGYIKNKKAYKDFRGKLFLSVDNAPESASILKRWEVKKSGALPFHSMNLRKLSKNIGEYSFGGCCSTIFLPFQFLLYTGIKSLYLVGCDADRNGYTKRHRALRNQKNKGSYSSILRMWKFSYHWASANYREVKITVLNPRGLRALGWEERRSKYI